MKYFIDSIQIILKLDAELLESPVFDKKNKFLYFVSILNFRVYRYCITTKKTIYIQFNSPTSCIYLTLDFGVVSVSSEGFYSLDFNNLKKKKIYNINLNKNLRFNDGILDKKGRFLIGTMGYPKVIDSGGSLLSFFKGKMKVLIPKTTISNGIAFSKNNKKMFYIDTPTRCVSLYNYNINSGDCYFKKKIIKFEKEGVPDGMVIDNEENLWIAEWGGSCISIWDSKNGRNIDKINLPSRNITSLCFDENNNVFVTSAKDSINDYSCIYHIKIKKNEKKT